MHGFIEEGLGGPTYTPWMYEDRKIIEPLGGLRWLRLWPSWCWTG
jgi:hypothetical protein